MFIIFFHVSINSIFTTVFIHFPENFVCLLQTYICIDYRSILTLASQKAFIKLVSLLPPFNPQVPENFM